MENGIYHFPNPIKEMLVQGWFFKVSEEIALIFELWSSM